MTSQTSFSTSRLLACMVVAVPLGVWALAPSNDNGFVWPGTLYVAVVAGIALACVAAFTAKWATLIPLGIAAAGWLVMLGALLYDDLVNGGTGGIGSGLIALGALIVVALATGTAMLTPIQTSDQN